MIEITVPGRPCPKERPRMAVKGKKAYLYTPAATKNYEETVGLCARQKVKKPLSCPVEVFAEFYFKPGNTPDLDNCVKSLLDGMNGIAYEDDRQVKRLRAEIKPCQHAKQQRAEVKIRGLTG